MQQVTEIHTFLVPMNVAYPTIGGTRMPLSRAFAVTSSSETQRTAIIAQTAQADAPQQLTVSGWQGATQRK